MLGRELLVYVQERRWVFSLWALFQLLRDSAEDPDEQSPVVRRERTKPSYILPGEGEVID